jgi:hypothetical protein
MTGKEYKRAKWRERKARWRMTKKLLGEKRTDLKKKIRSIDVRTSVR